MTFLTACPTREEIEVAIWTNNGPIPASICAREPVLQKLGFKRKLDNGRTEFISFCKPCDSQGHGCVADWLAMHERDVRRLLDSITPKPSQQKANEVPDDAPTGAEVLDHDVVLEVIP